MMRNIGYHIKGELKLSDEEVAWLIGIAQAVLRAFSWDKGEPISHLAEGLKTSRQTMYTTLRWAVASLIWTYRNKTKINGLVERVQALEERLAQVEQAYSMAQAEVQRLTQALSQAQERIAGLQAQVQQLQAQWQMSIDRLIVVLKLEGRCTLA